MSKALLGGMISALLTVTGTAQAADREGVTNMTFSASHGTQVEYIATNGRSYLWYPGNRVVLGGEWRYAPFRTASGPMPGICFRYGANTYNPATGAGGGGWECEPVVVYRSHVVDLATGDVFGLSRSPAAPFDLPSSRTTLDALRARL